MDRTERKVMIRLSGVEKEYRLGQIGSGTLHRDLQSWWARRQGREDPNSRIGQAARVEGDRLLALRGIDLTVYEGECLGIIGGNGAGKSTLLKLISRVTAPTRGSLDLYGRVTSMLEVGTGFHGEMTGLENIYLNGAILGMNTREIREVLEEIIDFSEVRDFIDTPVKRYSSGMYVKLGFSVAAHLKSEIVIMDEVLAVGDMAFQKKCIDRMLHAAHEENRTVLYVSHNMNTVRQLCDRCIVLDQGRIIYDGDTEEAIRYYSEYLERERGLQRDLRDYIRRDRNLTGICRVEEAGADNNEVRIGEDLCFRIGLRCRENRDNVRLRLLVCNSQGTIVGMTFSEPCRVREGYNRLQCAFSTEPLAAGAYICDIVVCEFEKNIQIRHDFVSKVLAFRINENEMYFGQPWTVRNWGNVRLSPVRIDAAEEGDDA